MKESAQAASQVLDRLDQACRGLVITGCFDEIFFHGKPVLVGVEPHSMAWVLGTHAADRSASTWTGALHGFNALEQAVVDGGRGMQRGLADFQMQRKRRNRHPSAGQLGCLPYQQERSARCQNRGAASSPSGRRGRSGPTGRVRVASRRRPPRLGRNWLTPAPACRQAIREEARGEQRAAYGEEIVRRRRKT